MESNSYQFPSLNIPESQKDEEWYKKYTLAIVNSTMGGSHDLQYSAMQENYDFYDGTQDVDKFDFMQQTEGGDTLPAVWINYNKIRVKVNSLVGELKAKGYEVSVTALNKGAVSKKLEDKFSIQGKMQVNDAIQEMSKQSGIPMGAGKMPNLEGVPTAQGTPLPESNEDLEDWMNRDYKSNTELVMEGLLQYYIKKYEWDYDRLSCFRDIMIAGRCFVKSELINGNPQQRRVDPRHIVFDTSAEDDFLKTSTFIGEVRYEPYAEVCSKYHLTKDEKEEIYEDMNSIGGNNAVNPLAEKEDNLKFYKGNKVMVFYGEWYDTKPLKRKKSVDKYGNEHYKAVDPKSKQKKDIQSKEYKVVRKCTLVGGKIVRDYGCLENMVKSVDNIWDTNYSYSCLIPNYVNYNTISTVDMLKGLQEMKDMTMYNLQIAMSRAGAKGFTYDLAQVPDNWEVEDVLKYLKTAGIAFTNSKQDGIPMSQNSFKEFDMTISQSINQYIAISDMVDRQMDEISGINSIRQGVQQQASQTVGVTQAAVQHSNMATATLFDFFRMFSTHVYEHLAGLIKISWEDKEHYAHLIGDVGYDFLKNDVDLALNDYGVFVEEVAPLFQDRQKLEQYTQAAVQSGKLEIVDAIDLINERNPDIAARKLKKSIEKKQKQDHAKQMQMQQAQMQAQAQQQQAQMQAQQQQVQFEEQSKTQRQQQQTAQTSQERMKQEEQKHTNRVKEDLFKDVNVE